MLCQQSIGTTFLSGLEFVLEIQLHLPAADERAHSCLTDFVTPHQPKARKIHGLEAAGMADSKNMQTGATTHNFTK